MTSIGSNIVKTYTKKKNNDIVNLSKLFTDIFIGESKEIEKREEFLKAPILALKILVKIVDAISYEQFRKNNIKQHRQYKLFEDEFMSDKNLMASFVFKMSDFDKYYNYKNWKNALVFLTEFRKGYYVTYNGAGKKIETYSGLISNHSISQGKVNFLVPNFWLEKLMNIENYNRIFFHFVSYIKKPKHFLFYLYLRSLEKSGGTVKSLENFNNDFFLNYKTSKDLAKNFLKPYKKLFDLHSDISFNYSIKGNNINIVIYYPDLKIKNLNPGTIDKQKLKSKLHYLKNRFNLSEENFKRLKKTFNFYYVVNKSELEHLFKAYDIMIKAERKNKRPVSKFNDSTGDYFMRVYDHYIGQYYKNLSNKHFKNNYYKKPDIFNPPELPNS